jgi:hypothetical protein
MRRLAVGWSAQQQAGVCELNLTNSEAQEGQHSYWMATQAPIQVAFALDVCSGHIGSFCELMDGGFRHKVLRATCIVNRDSLTGMAVLGESFSASGCHFSRGD